MAERYTCTDTQESRRGPQLSGRGWRRRRRSALDATKRGRHGRWPTAKQPRRKIPSRGRAKACSPTNRMPSGAEHHGECRWTASRKTKQAPRQERESRTHRVLGPRRLSKTNESKAREKKREEKRLFNVADSARPAVQFSRCSADHHHSSRLDQTERGTGTQT